MIDINIFSDLYNLGLHPVPVVWDVEKKIVDKYPEHVNDTVNGVPSLEDVQRWLLNGMRNSNGIAVKLFPPYGMFDFDLKNTTNKNIYSDWLKIIESTNPEILRKVCIETTRTNGYHVYIKYHKLDHKIAIARNEKGDEVVSVYTGGLLSFCYPSPNYSLIHNDFNDIESLTDDEFELLVSTAALFNEDKEYTPGSETLQPIEYPVEYESLLIQFDTKCTDDVFETILNSIDLYRVKPTKEYYKRKFWLPFLRKGSVAEYSAKAYFKSKRLIIFSASMRGFPTWHDSAKSGDNRISLSPSKIIYYKNGRSWPDAIAEIQMIIDSAGLDISEQKPVTNQPLLADDRLKFPYDIFPEPIQNFIFSQVIQHEYLAGAILAAISTAIGNSVTLEAMDGYTVKPIIYMAIVAPPGASKSPALKKAFAPLEQYDANMYSEYSQRLTEFKQALSEYEKDKKKGEKPEKPPFPQTLIKDSTIEMVVKILSCNTSGCCVFADELSGFLNRMNQYKAGDEVQKWLELWSGSPILLQRITRDENKVQEPYCNIVGGIQPGVLESLSKAENEHNGFYHRFLFVYPVPQNKSAWQRIIVPDSVKYDFKRMFDTLISQRTGETSKLYLMSEQANTTYGEWFNNKNARYNRAQNDHVKGIIAKYQDYCLRFALLLQVVYDGDRRLGIIYKENMERAIRLTEYFFGNMNKAIKILTPETPVDKLQGAQLTLYKTLPECFSAKTIMAEGEKLGMKSSTIKMFLNRNINKLFNKIETGKYEKSY